MEHKSRQLDYLEYLVHRSVHHVILRMNQLIMMYLMRIVIALEHLVHQQEQRVTMVTLIPSRMQMAMVFVMPTINVRVKMTP